MDVRKLTESDAEAFWNTNVRKQQGTVHVATTDNVLALGSVDQKTLDSIAKAAERAVVFAKKSVGYDKTRPLVHSTEQRWLVLPASGGRKKRKGTIRASSGVCMCHRSYEEKG